MPAQMSVAAMKAAQVSRKGGPFRAVLVHSRG
jgi:hypothetical protein